MLDVSYIISNPEEEKAFKGKVFSWKYFGSIGIKVMV